MTDRNDKHQSTSTPVATGRILFLACLFWVTMPGCQAEKQVVEKKATPTYEVRVSGSSRAVAIDPATAVILKQSAAPIPTRNESATESLPVARADNDPIEDTPIIATPEDKGPANENQLADDDAQIATLSVNVPAQVPVQAESFEALVDEGGVPLEPAMPALAESSVDVDELITIDMGQVPLVVVIDLVSENTGINFIWAQVITETVWAVSPTPIRLGDLYEYLLSLLIPNGYVAVPVDPLGKLVRIVPSAQAKNIPAPIREGSDPAQIPLDHTLVTQIMKLSWVDVGEVSPIVKGMLSGNGVMETHRRTNTLIITDLSANIHNIAEIIQTLDVPEAKPVRKVIKLQYASALELSNLITKIMESDSASPAAAGPNRTRRPNTATQIQAPISIVPDSRTSSLTVTASPADMDQIFLLVEKLDVERSSGGDNVHVVFVKNATAKELAESLTRLNFGEVLDPDAQPPRIGFDAGSNALIITAPPQDFAVLAKVIEELDRVRVQVLVEMQIMEVSEDVLEEFGIDWATLEEAVSSSARGFVITNFGPRLDLINGTNQGISAGIFKEIGGAVSIGSVLQALQDHRGVNILSRPYVMTTNHHQAEIVIADNIARIIKSTISEDNVFAPSVIQEIEYFDVGVTLKITPHAAGGRVQLEVDSEFSKLIEGAPGQSSKTPTTARRAVKTVSTVDSGSTVVIGGLLRDDKVSVKKQIPLLGDLPLIGGLFRWTREEVQKTNLLIYITPIIVEDQAKARAVTQQKIREMQPVLKGRMKQGDSQDDDGSTIWK